MCEIVDIDIKGSQSAKDCFLRHGDEHRMRKAKVDLSGELDFKLQASGLGSYEKEVVCHFLHVYMKGEYISPCRVTFCPATNRASYVQTKENNELGSTRKKQVGYGSIRAPVYTRTLFFLIG